MCWMTNEIASFCTAGFKKLLNGIISSVGFWGWEGWWLLKVGRSLWLELQYTCVSHAEPSEGGYFSRCKRTCATNVRPGSCKRETLPRTRVNKTTKYWWFPKQFLILYCTAWTWRVASAALALIVATSHAVGLEVFCKDLFQWMHNECNGCSGWSC